MHSKLEAAKQAWAVQMHYARCGKTLSEVALAGASRFEEYRHYPKKDVVDLVSGYQFYYHSHQDVDYQLGHHGHFHLFKTFKNRDFVHLGAIAMNQQGLPVCLFTTNRWVTAEVWKDAATVLRHLRRFNVKVSGRMQPIAKWLKSLTQLLDSEFERILHQRDQRMRRLLSTASAKDIWEDRSLHVMSSVKVNWLKRLAVLDGKR